MAEGRDDPAQEPRARPILSPDGASPDGLSDEAASPERAPALAPGTAIHRYVIESEIGSGAMGTVYAARDRDLDRRVALKLLRHPRRGGTQGQRLLREAKALARLSHPNVVAVYDAGSHGSELYLVMELVDGQTLRSWLSEAPRTWQEVLDVMRRAGEGLAAAHVAGMVHRDFKPDNVLLDRAGRVRVGDFGVALLGDVERADVPSPSPADATTLTSTGLAVGTPAYMAPEQYEASAPVDARADQFAFCVALYEGIHGQRPFGGNTASELAGRIERGAIDPPPRGGEPAWLRKAILRGLARDPDRRYPSMDALLAALARDPARRRRRWIAAGVGAALLAVLVSGAVRLRAAERPAPCQGAAARLAGVWDPARKAAVAAAFRATGSALAGEALSRVDRALDQRARDWVSLHRSSCEATRLRHLQPESTLDLAMQCLDRRLTEMRALTDALAAADGPVVTRAVQAVDGLAPLASCADPAALTAEVPLPEPSRKGAVDALRERLARLEALHLTGHYREALEPSKALAADARALGYRPIEAEALLLLGKLERQTDQLNPAETTFYDAIAAAKAGRAGTVEMESWLELVWLVGQDQMRYEDARRLARVARGALDRLPERERFEAALADWEGALLIDESVNMEAARPLLEHALALRQRVHGGDSLEVAATISHLADLALSQRDPARALQLYRRSRAISERALGPDHPDAYGSLAAEGIALGDLGQREEQLAAYRRGLELATRVYGPDSFDAAIYLADIGLVLNDDEQYAEARGYHERAKVIMERIYGTDHPNAARAYINLSTSLREMGEYKEALTLLERAAAIFEAHGESDHANLAVALINQGEAYLSMGDAGKARELAERGLELHRRASTPDQELAWGWFLLARALRAEDPAGVRPRELAERARVAFEASGDHAMAAKARSWLAAARAARR